MHPYNTRNAARIRAAAEQILKTPPVTGERVIITPSETGEGLHYRWQYSEDAIPAQAPPVLARSPSLSSLSSLSTLTASEEDSEMGDEDSHTADPQDTADSEAPTPQRQLQPLRRSPARMGGQPVLWWHDDVSGVEQRIVQDNGGPSTREGDVGGSTFEQVLEQHRKEVRDAMNRRTNNAENSVDGDSDQPVDSEGPGPSTRARRGNRAPNPDGRAQAQSANQQTWRRRPLQAEPTLIVDAHGPPSSLTPTLQNDEMPFVRQPTAQVTSREASPYSEETEEDDLDTIEEQSSRASSRSRELTPFVWAPRRGPSPPRAHMYRGEDGTWITEGRLNDVPLFREDVPLFRMDSPAFYQELGLDEQDELLHDGDAQSGYEASSRSPSLAPTEIAEEE